MKTRKFAALAASLAMTAAMTAMAVPAAAQAATTYSSTLVTETNKQTTKLDKYLVMKNDSNVPNSTFTFAVTVPESGISATNTTLAVIPGVLSPTLTDNGTMTFSTSDATIPEADAGTATGNTDTPVFSTPSDSTDEKYVKKTLTLDFSSVQFTEPGVYRYYIEEDGSNQGVANDYNNNAGGGFRTLDVYVEDAGTTDTDGKPQLKITGYVMYNGKQTAGPNKEETTPAPATGNGAEVDGATKNDTITNFYPSQNLIFGKAVKGNQGSKDKYFEFTLVIGKIQAENTKISVDVSNADATLPTSINSATNSDFAGKTNPDELIANTTQTGYTVTKDATSGEYTITAKYYLQHGQYITVKGIPKGATYSVTEAEEDYDSKDEIEQADSFLNWDGTTGNDALDDDVSGEIESSDIHVGYTNTREGAIPTGILSTIGGSVALAAVGIAGIAGGAMYLKKKKSEED